MNELSLPDDNCHIRCATEVAAYQIHSVYAEHKWVLSAIYPSLFPVIYAEDLREVIHVPAVQANNCLRAFVSPNAFTQ